jgi:hypothetical protein
MGTLKNGKLITEEEFLKAAFQELGKQKNSESKITEKKLKTITTFCEKFYSKEEVQKRLNSKGHWEGDFDCSHRNLTGNLTIPEGFSVGGGFYCSYNNLTSITIPDGFSCGGGFYCAHNNLISIIIPKDMSISGTFYCSYNNLTSITIPDGFSCGGSFYCSHNKLTSITIPENFSVGGDFYYSHNKLTSKPKVITYEDKAKIFAKIGFTDPTDGIFSKPISHKTKNGYQIIKAVTLGNIPTFIVKKDGLASHGKTIKDALHDLSFKSAKNRGSDQFKNLDINAIRPLEELTIMYRLLTGACNFGVTSWINSHNPPKKASIKQAISLTQDAYGHQTFKNFFATA